MMSDVENKITIRICSKRPIELIDFTECFLGVGQQYIRFLSKNPDMAEVNDIRLFVKEVRQGSTIVDLIALAPLALPFMCQANSLIGFSKNMISIGKYLLGEGKKPKNIEKPDYEQFNKITTPVAKDSSCQFNLSVVVNGDINMHPSFDFNHIEANAMQNVISRDIKALREPIERLHKKVLLYWYQARNDNKSNAGDRATIESISPFPQKTIFAFDSLKHEMLFGSHENPFHYAYVVDVVVDTIQERPAAYKIVEFHEKFTKPTDDDTQQKRLF